MNSCSELSQLPTVDRNRLDVRYPFDRVVIPRKLFHLLIAAVQIKINIYREKKHIDDTRISTLPKIH